MKKLGKVLTVLLPVVALFLESLPYGAVLIFKDFPDGQYERLTHISARPLGATQTFRPG